MLMSKIKRRGYVLRLEAFSASAKKYGFTVNKLGKPGI